MTRPWIVPTAERQALPLALAGSVAMLASFGSTVALARFLGDSDYGTIIQLLGLLLILTMPGTAVTVGVLRRLAQLDRDGSAIGDVWLGMAYRNAICVGMAWLVSTIALAGPISSMLSLSGTGALWPILAAAGPYLMLSVDRGLMQARRAYRSLAANWMIEGCMRGAGMVGFAVVGRGPVALAWALLASEVIAAMHGRAVARRLTAPRGDGIGIDAMAIASERSFGSELFVALAALALLATLQNLDIIVLGSLDHGSSGAYAAISVSAKSLVFWAMFTSNYLLPESALHAQRGSKAGAQLGLALAAVLLPAGALVSLAAAVPRTLLSVAFNQHSHEAAAALLPLAAAMTLLSVTVALTLYSLGMGWGRHLPVLALGVIALSALTIHAHGNVELTAVANLRVQACLTLAMCLTSLASSRAAPRHRRRGAP